jgi:hypothetical protein
MNLSIPLGENAEAGDIGVIGIYVGARVLAGRIRDKGKVGVAAL